MSDRVAKWTSDEWLDALHERCNAFFLLELPRQPQAMHMGTSYLVSDLQLAVDGLRKARQPSEPEAPPPAERCFGFHRWSMWSDTGRMAGGGYASQTARMILRRRCSRCGLERWRTV